MSINTIYGFLSDSGLSLQTSIDLTGSSDQGFGYLHGEALNYLIKKGIIRDTRSSRLPIVENEKLPGSMSIWFDQNRVNLDEISTLSKTDIEHIFNIIERCVLAQQYTDFNIEEMLTTNTLYKGYVANSHQHDPNITTIKIQNVKDYIKNVDLHNYVGFDYASENVTLHFHIWIKLSAFSEEYPYVTITKVIPPYDPALLVDGNAVLKSTNLDILANSSAFIFNTTDNELATRDQNGVYSFKVKYIIGETSRNLSFALAYCGNHTPSSLDCRSAIKEMFKSTTGIADEELRLIFPELFIDSRFYIVPMWDIYSQLVDRDVYNSVGSISKLLEKARIIFNDVEDSFRNTHLELLLNSQNKMWSVCLPDQLNTSHMSILEQHPTYVDYSAQSVGWKYLTADTQEFAGKLIRIMAVMRGETTSSEFVPVTEGNKDYLTFTAGESEYYVLTKDCYETLINNS